MELAIMQNGTLYAVQRTPTKDSRRNRRELTSADTTETLPTIRTSVGEFAIRSTQGRLLSRAHHGKGSSGAGSV
jgi:hypothetical protein